MREVLTPALARLGEGSRIWEKGGVATAISIS
jgi:hypothetical protein